MKLYYSTGACSMSCVIGAFETNTKVELIEVSWQRNENVAELEKLNPLGVAPVLVLDDGQIITQNTAILEYFADKAQARSFLPAPGTADRAKTSMWLSFVASDFHKAFVPLFGAKGMLKDTTAQNELTGYARNQIGEYLSYLEKNLAGKTYITGENFTAADAYLLVTLRWCQWMDITFAKYPSVEGYLKRACDRPSAKKAIELEGDDA